MFFKLKNVYWEEFAANVPHSNLSWMLDDRLNWIANSTRKCLFCFRILTTNTESERFEIGRLMNVLLWVYGGFTLKVKKLYMLKNAIQCLARKTSAKLENNLSYTYTKVH